ncbi:hypothetical protein [Edaphobacter aggregans]|uniref:hypothetical protein n=1 Tax=Edaphobacter aggregans TaxID=570835 RepID=UPI00054DED51|nr:hypothetical protein [Edaphobacter aggregans]
MSTLWLDGDGGTFDNRYAFNGVRSFTSGLAHSKGTAMSVSIRGRDSDGSFAPEGVSRSVSRLLLGHGVGAMPAPCGGSLFCFGTAALRVTVSRQIYFAKCSEKISPEPP